MRKISENTPITIGVVITLLGGMYFVSTIYNRGEANASDIQDLKTKFDKFQEKQEKIGVDVEVIKNTVGRIEKSI